MNVDADDDLIKRVQRLYGLRTKREAFDFALRRLLLVPMTVDEARAMRGSGWDGDLERLRDGSSARS